MFAEAALIKEKLGLCNLPLTNIGKWLTSTNPILPHFLFSTMAWRSLGGKDQGAFLPHVRGLKAGLRGER